MPETPTINVVFVHGLFSSPKVWDSFTALLAEDPDLRELATAKCLRYDSPLFRLRPDRGIAEIDDVADRLRTFLRQELPGTDPVVLVTHSQGGLIAQRCLIRMLHAGEGRQLRRIAKIVMYACPNSGSEFFLSMRKRLPFWRHPQERQLRPYNRAVLEAQREMLKLVISAPEATDSQCPIPILALSGMADKIVPPHVSSGIFPLTEMVDGDHFSVVRPKSRDDSQYQVLRRTLLEIINGLKPERAEREKASAPTESSPETYRRVSVAPPFGRMDHPLVGRETLMASIRAGGGGSRVRILAGLGGSGKSRLALEIAHQAWQSGQRVWWISLPRISSCMREVANQLGVPEARIDRAWRGNGSPTDLVWEFLDAQPGRWLLVIDNADDPQILAPLNGVVADGTGWLRSPAGPNGAVIVTSRDRNQATWGNWSTVHVVPPLGLEDATAMLMNQAGKAGGTSEGARRLARELGGHPLALRTAADYLKSVNSTKVWLGSTPIKDFDSYCAAVKRRFEYAPGARSRADNEMDLESLEKVFHLSLELLVQRGFPQAGPLLKLFACLSIAPIPYGTLLNSEVLAESSLFSGMGPNQMLAVLEALADLGLIEPYLLDNFNDPQLSHVVSLHPVVHGIMRDDEDVRLRRDDYYGLNVSMLLAAVEEFDPDLPESWTRWDLIVPHCIEVARTALIGEPQLGDRRVLTRALELARLTSRFLIVTGLLGPAEDLVTPIVTRCQSFGFALDDRELLALRHELARMALERGDPQSAERDLRAIITARTQVLGEDHPDTLASGHKLAKAILEQGRWDEAEPLLRAILEAENHVRGPEHSDTMVVRHSLARAILAQGRPQEAEIMLRDILNVRHKHWTPTNPETLFARLSLSFSLLDQERVAEAEAELRDALALVPDRLEEPRVMQLRFSLIQVKLLQGHVQEAIEALGGLAKDQAKVLGSTHPQTEETFRLLERARDKLSGYRE
ncbi:alpha/beta hydrolase [Microbispora sp. ATCC PTA-5024]|uniref:alpha/beta hydrolase n=1 Tax=Microbispora sp. ATCC PTA-5024 TaxID=316330 RepID=UPI0006EB2A28|nr:alpha/beta fold hydrolase [Microbispora sp. ATCC PTA-5024]